MSKLEITRGKWEISPYNNWECAVLTGDDAHHIEVFNSDIDGWEQMHGNATLICDAGNTFQSCGLLPSELLKQREELLDENDRMRSIIENEEEKHFAFMEWIGKEANMLYFPNSNGKWLLSRLVKGENPSVEYDEYTTAELFEYWKQNVEVKQ